jgi:hypothetical protein
VTRDDVLRNLWTARAEFDRLLSEIPPERLSEPIPGRARPAKDIVWHIAAYDDLMVRRLRAARDGETTAFERDRVGWEEFNERIWAEAAELDAATVCSYADETFLDLLEEVGQLSDGEACRNEGLVEHIDPAWLQGRTLAVVIGVDGFEHYPMHFDELRAAAVSLGGAPQPPADQFD